MHKIVIFYQHFKALCFEGKKDANPEYSPTEKSLAEIKTNGKKAKGWTQPFLKSKTFTEKSSIVFIFAFFFFILYARVEKKVQRKKVQLKKRSNDHF